MYPEIKGSGVNDCALFGDAIEEIPTPLPPATLLNPGGADPALNPPRA